jgi:branched-chain amino acid transport system substrate-binding protein
VELALDFKGELLGHTLELQTEDEGCSAEGGQTSALKIVSNPQVVAVIGTSCSGAAVPAAEIVSDAGYVMVSPSNTSPALTDPDMAWQPGYLRTVHNDKYQGSAMAVFAYHELGLTIAAAIYDGDPYTESLAIAFANAFEELGGRIIAFEALAPDATDVEPLLASIATQNPEFIFYPTFIPLGSLITNTARDIEALDSVVLAASDGIFAPSFLENTLDASEGLYVSSPDYNFENDFYLDEFLPAYREKYGIEPTTPFHAHSYDATMLVLQAVEQVAQQKDDGTLVIGRQALRDALYGTSEYEGVTGRLTCNEFGDCGHNRILINVVEGGEFVQKQIIEPAGAQAAADETVRDLTDSDECSHLEPWSEVEIPWLSNIVTLDGTMTNTTEWSDAVCLDLTLQEPDYTLGEEKIQSRWWLKNDDTWLYLLVRVPTVELKEGMTEPFYLAAIDHFWPEWSEATDWQWPYSDGGSVDNDNVAYDVYGWDGSNWYMDIEASPPGEHNVEGALSEDETYVWFEFRKALDSGDEYDWSWPPGRVVDEGSTIVGVLGKAGTWFEINLVLTIGSPPE